MTTTELLQKFSSLNIWRQGDQRAPHKPFVILTALAELQRKGSSRISYAEKKDHLIRLLKDFGPQRKSYHPEEPFARLANEKETIWILEGDLPINTKSPSTNRLIEANATGQFSANIEGFLLKNDAAARELAQMILDEHFPPSIHEDIIDAVGLDMAIIKAIRDPAFRNKIMIAYERRCAICSFNVQLGDTYIGLDAAHIKWKKAHGPDTETNGLLLCTMHHKLFDRGAFTVNEKMEIMISDQAHGTFGFQEWLMDYQGQKLRLPQRQQYYPEPSFTDWHVREVFHGRYRE